MLINPTIRIDLSAQRLDLLEGARLIASYPVSTSKYGGGELRGSHKTPRGRHVIRAKIGDGQPRGAVFVGRRPTGEIYSESLACAYPGRDWILTRIMWLSGLDIGINRLGAVDTMRRYIYIHGTPDSVALGEPGSIGCIRMANDALLELFDRVPTGTVVDIVESPA